MDNDLSYSDAFAALEKLVTEIEDDNMQLDMLADKVAQANELIKYCETKLRAIEADVKAKSES